jgi:hypothetical protein
MRAMVVEVGPEIEQFVFEICLRPEQDVIQILASNGAILWRSLLCGAEARAAHQAYCPWPLRNISCFVLLYSLDGYSIPNFGGRRFDKLF